MTATTRFRPRLTTIIGTAIAAAVATTSCGIPQDDKPQPIAREALPAPVVETASTTTTRPTTVTRDATLFLVRERTDPSEPETLETVTAPVPVSADPNAFPRAVLDQLVRGTTAEQVARGLRSDIPTTVKVLDTRRDDNSVLSVNLTDLGKVEGPKQRVAVAQIVFTATALDGVRAVRFLIDGQPTAIPIDQGSSQAGASISRDDFPRFKRQLEPGSAATTTTTTTTTSSSSTTTSSSSTPP